MEAGDSTRKGKKIMKRYIMKALSNFGDFYVKTMNGLARKMGSTVSYCPPPSNIRVVDLPRSFSASSSRVMREEDFAELMRAAALKLKKDHYKINNNQNQNPYAGDGTMMKSSSDHKSDSFVKETVELFGTCGSCLDTVYEEGEGEDDLKVSPLMLTRSRSYGGGAR